MKNKKFIYILLLVLSSVLIFAGCSGKNSTSNENTTEESNAGEIKFADLKFDHSMELKYAKNFSIDYYEDGYSLITIDSNDHRFLVVPEGAAAPVETEADIVVLQKPINNIYLVATQAMAFFDALDSIDAIRFSGSKADSWYIEEAKKKMESGDILYAGKYSEPDYETLLSENCTLSIQSGMILHSPDVKEKLEELGIKVLMDRASYEKHPLGRTEWIKLYGVLFDKEEMAEELFEKQAKVLDELENKADVEKKVAFFYINSQGSVVTRKSTDYVATMIELAGGKYAFENLGDPESATSTVAMGMEEFYATAKDADYIIYNSTITGEVKSIEELLNKNQLLADFKAVKDGNVWCTEKNIYQSTDQFGDIIMEINKLLFDDTQTELPHFYKLQ